MKRYIVETYKRDILRDGEKKQLIRMSPCFYTHEEAEVLANELGEKRKASLGLKDSNIIRNKNFVTVNDFVDNVEWFYLVKEYTSHGLSIKEKGVI